MSDATDVTELDVRSLDGEPFGAIVTALEALPPDGTLLVRNDFEPVPLYEVLERRGFRYETTRVDAETWHVAISRVES